MYMMLRRHDITDYTLFSDPQPAFDEAFTLGRDGYAAVLDTAAGIVLWSSPAVTPEQRAQLPQIVIRRRNAVVMDGDPMEG